MIRVMKIQAVWNGSLLFCVQMDLDIPGNGRAMYGKVKVSWSVRMVAPTRDASKMENLMVQVVSKVLMEASTRANGGRDGLMEWASIPKQVAVATKVSGWRTSVPALAQSSGQMDASIADPSKMAVNTAEAFTKLPRVLPTMEAFKQTRCMGKVCTSFQMDVFIRDPSSQGR